MYEMDKRKFGAFVAMLRKEKGVTQKELAEQLHISDKAVSKWETGHSIPDVTLLIPLAEYFGVSVTELLECRRMDNPGPMDTLQTDELVKKVIELSEEEYTSKKKRNLLIYLVSVFLSVMELCCLYTLHEMGVLYGTPYSSQILVVVLLAVIFGAYFWIFIKEKLPAYYDENQISVYVDGMLHMNIPGVYYNNHNWSYIVKALRGWSLAGMVLFPIAFFPLHYVLYPFFGQMHSLVITLGFVLGGLFVPIYILGRKYQYGDNPPPQKKGSSSKKNWIVLMVLLFVLLFASVIGMGGLGTIRSGTRIMFFSNEGRSYWNASYQFLDGFMQRNLWVEQDGLLELEVETEDGMFSIEILDKDGNILFKEEDMETQKQVLELETLERVTIRIRARGHKGGFAIY